MVVARSLPNMRRPVFSRVAPEMAELASKKRLLGTKSRPGAMLSDSAAAAGSLHTPMVKTTSSRFNTAKPGTVVSVKTASPSTLPPPKEPPTATGAFDTPEGLHRYDIIMRNGWNWLFPRGQCPDWPWWQVPKPLGSSAAGLRWTAGRMYRHFWLRVRKVLVVSGSSSGLLATVTLQGLILHSEGQVPENVRLGAFATVALSGLAWGVFRSRIIPEAWMGLVGSKEPMSGGSMMPTLPPLSRWTYIRQLRPLNVKRGEVVCLCNPVQHDPRFDSRATNWLGKRIVGLENDVIRTGELGIRDRPYFQVPKGHVFVLGDNVRLSLDSRSFGPVPITYLRGKIKFWTAVENPKRREDWQRVPIVKDVNRLIVTDPEELERTRCEWEERSMDKEPWEIRLWNHPDDLADWMSTYRPIPSMRKRR